MIVPRAFHSTDSSWGFQEVRCKQSHHSYWQVNRYLKRSLHFGPICVRNFSRLNTEMLSSICNLDFQMAFLGLDHTESWVCGSSLLELGIQVKPQISAFGKIFFCWWYIHDFNLKNHPKWWKSDTCSVATITSCFNSKARSLGGVSFNGGFSPQIIPF